MPEFDIYAIVTMNSSGDSRSRCARPSERTWIALKPGTGNRLLLDSRALEAGKSSLQISRRKLRTMLAGRAHLSLEASPRLIAGMNQ
jgi:hypothetical protein